MELPESGMQLVVQGKTAKQDRALILGFAAFDEQSIRKAVHAWAAALG